MKLSLTRRKSGAETPVRGDGFSVLHANMTVLGDLETDGTVRIDGRLAGSVLRADVVVVGASASVTGNITAREVIIGGAVHGNVDAADRAEVQPTAVVTGDIEAGAVMIQEGGAVRGRLCVRSRDAQSAGDAHARAKSLTPRVLRRLAAGASDAS
jgi:cytoskeletal protein CcmA (bactofilin family)